MTLAADREMPMPKRTHPADEAVAADRRDLSLRHGESSRGAQGFRAAYEALIEPLIKATIKLAAAETEQQAQRPHIAAFETQIADTRGQLHATQERLGETQERLGDTQQRLGDTQQRLAETQAALALMEEKRDRL